MPQLATVARALLLVTETGTEPRWYLSACALRSAQLLGASRRRWEALVVGEAADSGQEGYGQPQSERRALHCTPSRSWGGGTALATQKGLFAYHLLETWKSCQFWFKESMWITWRTGFCSKRIWVKNCWVPQFCRLQANWQFLKFFNFTACERTGALPQGVITSACRAGSSLACVVSSNVSNDSTFCGALVFKQPQTHIGNKVQNYITIRKFEAILQSWFHVDFANTLHFCIFHYNSHVQSNFAISYQFCKHTSRSQ